MKAMDILCAAEAATAVCSRVTMEQVASSPSAAHMILLGSSPAIDRYNPMITRDSSSSSSTRSTTAANSKQVVLLPPPHPTTTTLIPKQLPHHHNKKKKKKVPAAYNFKQVSDDDDDDDEMKKKKKNHDHKNMIKIISGRKSWSCTKPGDFISPPGSTRYLLSTTTTTTHHHQNLNNNNNNNNLFTTTSFSDPAPALDLFPPEATNSLLLNTTNINININAVSSSSSSSDLKPPPSNSSSASPDQVVVLRVSLHCRGCEKKMRKHLSRMEGVSSFNIDFAAKKVTVTGKVTPVEVLSSISKVKNAQLWPPTISSSLSSSNGFKGAAGA